MKRSTANEITGIVFLFILIFVIAGAIIAFVNNARIDTLEKNFVENQVTT